MTRQEMFKEMWENFKRVMLLLAVYFGAMLVTHSVTTDPVPLQLALLAAGALNPWSFKYLEYLFS